MNTTLFYRFGISAIALLVYLFLKKEKLHLAKKEWLLVAVLGFLYAFSSDLLLLGYDLLTPGIASTVLFVYPVIVAVLLWIFFKEKLQMWGVISLLITFIGVLILSIQGEEVTLNYGGLFVGVLSALSYAVYMILINKSNTTLSGMKITFYSMLFSSVYYFMKSIVVADTLIPSASLFGQITVFALVTTVFSITTLVFAIQYIGATPTAIMGAFEPVVAVFISVVFFDEALSVLLVSGMILILVGVTLNVLVGSKKMSSKRKSSRTHVE